MHDLIIIGGSAAGCSAAIYAARRKLNFKIITDNMGGEVALSGEIGNWPGIQKIQGVELAKNFADHVKSYNVEIDEGYKVTKITSKEKHHVIEAENLSGDKKTYETKSIIIATGIHPRRLRIPGVEEFDKKGITYCTVCDGPLFRGKVTATIGSGNSALESAIMMSELAEKVYLISLFDNTKEEMFGFPDGETILADKVKTIKNIEILYKADTTEIFGDTKVRGLRYRDKEGNIQEIKVDGIMMHVGSIPNANFIDHIKKDDLGQIIIDEKCATSQTGIFAAGDVTHLPYKQIGIATGQGILAALSAIDYINKL